MAKYIKLEDAINKLDEWFCEPYTPTELLSDLPTIEVMEYPQVEGITPTLVSPEVSEDCISREQFREQMYHRCFEVDNDENMQKWDSGNWLRWKLFEEELENAPSVVPTQTNAIQHTQSVESVESVEHTTEQSSKVGEWIDYYYPHFEVAGIECSVCGEDVPYWNRYHKEPRFCPNCGSRMKG